MMFWMVMGLLLASVSGMRSVSSALPDACLADGQSVGEWLLSFGGYGCNSVQSFSDGKAVIGLSPKAASSPGETHSALALGRTVSGNFVFGVSLKTSQQLRSGSVPNPWEVGWVVWNYSDNSHFYYFIPKPNGWELGKRDPAYPGGQRFLATGSTPVFPIGQWHQVKIVQSGSSISVTVNGAPITRFSDHEAAYTSGRVGLYSEDAKVTFRQTGHGDWGEM
jgi:hypothetical protein